MIERHQRIPEDFNEYVNPNNQRSEKYVVDHVGPSVTGFYLLPGVWIAEENSVAASYEHPSPEELKFSRLFNLKCGVRFVSTIDGFFLL